MTCPLCDLNKNEPNNIIIQTHKAMLVRTKNLKGHRERLMICAVKHGFKLDWLAYAELWGSEIKKCFSYTYKVILLDGMYGSIPEHFHMCLTDLEPDSEDFHQILGTPWMGIIEVNRWKKTRDGVI